MKISNTLKLYALVLQLVLGLFWLDAGRSLDNQLLDAIWSWQHSNSSRASDMDPVIVGIDEAFLESIDEPIALTHNHLSALLLGLGTAQPRAVGIDLVLPEKRYDTLVSTKSAHTDYHRTLLVTLMSPTIEYPLMITKTWDPEKKKFRDTMPDYAVALGMRGKSSGLVSSLFCPNGDNVIRHFPGQGCQPDGFAGLAETLYTLQPTAQTELSGLINFGEGPAWTYIPMLTVMEWVHSGNTTALAETFKGRNVLVGTTLRDIDLLDTPVAIANWIPDEKRVSGVLLHAQALRSLGNNSVVSIVPSYLLIIGALIASLAWFTDTSRKKLLIVTMWVTGMTATSITIITTMNLWLPPMTINLVIILCAILRSMYDGISHYMTQQRLKSTFAGYVSPAVLTQITSGKISADRHGVSTHLCVLFSDIRGFTTLSEKFPPDVIVDILNRYFDHMTQIVHKHEGTVDKFIGDGLMAFFGAPNPLEHPEQQAVAAAQEMLLELQTFNQEMEKLGYPSIKIGIGIHSGPAIVGNVGARQRHAYTAIGDTVNTASRLESLCKTVGYCLVCSGNVYRASGSPQGWAALGEQALKGRAAMETFGWEASHS